MIFIQLRSDATTPMFAARSEEGQGFGSSTSVSAVGLPKLSVATKVKVVSTPGSVRPATAPSMTDIAGSAAHTNERVCRDRSVLPVLIPKHNLVWSLMKPVSTLALNLTNPF
jgi:hypothetical protein